MHRPILPPGSVVIADPGDKLHQSVAIYEILGAPEFRLFDTDGDVITTRPTRAQVNGALRKWLWEADLLSEDVRHARYLLSVTFTDLHGPDVVWFTDKNAKATVRYLIQDARTRQVVFDRTFDAAFQARMPGVTEEMVRSAISEGLFGGLVGGVVNDGHDESNAQIAAGIIGLPIAIDSGLFAWGNDTLLWDRPDADANLTHRREDGLPRGLFWSGVGVHGTDILRGNLSDVEAGFTVGAVGALSGFFGAAPVGRPPESSDSPDAIGAFDGTRRRREANYQMLLQNFNRFLFGLDEADLIKFRRAVTCDELNPNGFGGPAIITHTAEVVAWDCDFPTGRRQRQSEVSFTRDRRQ